MIVPDLNLLLYAINEEAPAHEAARIWRRCAWSTTRRSIARITTSPALPPSSGGIHCSPLSACRRTGSAVRFATEANLSDRRELIERIQDELGLPEMASAARKRAGATDAAHRTTRISVSNR